MNDKADDNSSKSKSLLGYKYPGLLKEAEKKLLLNQNNKDTLNDYLNYKKVCEKSVLKPVGSKEKKKMQKLLMIEI